ncbi:mycobacterial-type methylenetetrahydrofolate reductase [Mycobacteroides franklinii]|uniref:mycobacterial-type methylenetetrahydrofolate reductase n=1 Tax=Mycobacteroides franklinii TaxID=948102 RepID=UPI0009926B30|nr:mycobacterial-type methylenetetrahydrofolate reductase [Mycobacteroides franklinii]
MSMNTVALELVPPNVEGGLERASEELRKLRQFSAEFGIDERIDHVMIPSMIVEDSDRPLEMKPKLDVVDYWSIIRSEFPTMRGLCTQVTSFSDETSLRGRLTDLTGAGMDGVIFVGVPRTMSDGDGEGIPPTDALSKFDDIVENRGVILIPTRAGEQGRFSFKCDKGATFAMTQLLYSDAVVGFLQEFARTCDHRPEVLLSFGFVPKLETKVGLIDWLIQDPGNEAVAREQDFVKSLAGCEPDARRPQLVDLYKRVIDGVAELGFPLSVHFEVPYGLARPAFETFAEMLGYWSPAPAAS